MADQAPERVRRHLLRQAGWCDELGSPLSALLARTAADDVAAGGPVWSVLAPYADLPGADAVPLRLLAGVHRLVLSRRAPALAVHYPSAGGTAGLEGAGAAFVATVAEHPDELRALVARPLQTNEVARCAALLGGFLAVAPVDRPAPAPAGDRRERWPHPPLGSVPLHPAGPRLVLGRPRGHLDPGRPVVRATAPRTAHGDGG